MENCIGTVGKGWNGKINKKNARFLVMASLKRMSRECLSEIVWSHKRNNTSFFHSCLSSSPFPRIFTFLRHHRHRHNPNNDHHYRQYHRLRHHRLRHHPSNQLPLPTIPSPSSPLYEQPSPPPPLPSPSPLLASLA